MPSHELYGHSEQQPYYNEPEVASAEMLAIGTDIVPKVPRPMAVAARPVSPGTVEKAASLLRSLSFACGRPATGESALERAKAYAMVGATLRRELRGDQFERLSHVAPKLGTQLQSALLSSCGALLGAQHPDGAFEWASAELDELAKAVPPANAGVFPGAYYFEIFSSDVSDLSRALAVCRREDASRRSLGRDVLAVLGRPGAGAVDLLGIAKAAGDAGLAAEAQAARTVSDLAGREEKHRLAHESSAVEARDAKRQAKEHNENMIRAQRQLEEETRRRRSAEDELAAIRAALQSEEETRRKVEGANVTTLQELRALEEARWEAERRAQQEGVRATELEMLLKKAEEDAATRVSAAEAREARSEAEKSTASNRYVEAERMRVALQGRVTALEEVKKQLEMQLHLEREACAQEVGLRQKAETAVAESQQSLAEAQQAAAEGATAAEEAAKALEMKSSELDASEERLRVANEGSLAMHMETASAEDGLRQLKALRSDDAAKMQRLNEERASLQQTVQALEERLQGQAAAAERMQVEAGKQRYELHAQLTEVHRRCEDLQSAATKSELLLQHERESGSTASENEKRLASQLDAERRAKQALAQQLSAEVALRQKSDMAENATARELQARGREAELAAQRLQAVQSELHRAREEARAAREATADAKSVVSRLERERDTERKEEDMRRDRSHAERDARNPPAVPTRRMAGPAPSLTEKLSAPKESAPPASISAPRAPMPQTAINDELSRSDLWNFSSGALAREASSTRIDSSGGIGGGNPLLPRIKSPYNTVKPSEAGQKPYSTRGVLDKSRNLSTHNLATSLKPDEVMQLYGDSNASSPAAA